MPEEHSHLISSAREYFTEDFPNPSGKGCPSRERLNGVISSGAIPDDELRAHLFSCSACFVYLKSGRDARARTAPRPTAPWYFEHAISGGARSFAYAVLLLVTCLAGLAGWLLFVRGDKTGAPPTRGVTADLTTTNTPAAPTSGQAHAPSPPKSVNVPESKDPGPSRPRRPDEHKPALAANTIMIDLGGLQVLRGVGPTAGEHVVTAKQSLNRLLIKLPVDSPAGPYTVIVVDAFGEKVATGKTRSRGRRTLAVDIDIRKIPPKRYLLCISQEQGAPSCLPLNVTAGPQSSNRDSP